MDIKITGDACVITSKIKVEDIKKLAKANPDALKIKDKEGNDLFAISYRQGCSSIAPFGVTFGGVSRDDKGLATITIGVPSDADAKQYVADAVEGVKANIETLEKTVEAEAKKVAEARKALEESITIA